MYTTPQLADIFLWGARRTAPAPLCIEIEHQHVRMRLLLRCSFTHPEARLRGQALWAIEPEVDPHGATVLRLHHRNRRGARGWHPHGVAACTRLGILELLSAVRQHDEALYRQI